MTDIPREPGDEDAVLAAELALGLLGAEATRAAERRAADDPGFRSAVIAWREHFATLAGEVAPVAPPAGLARRIEARLFGAGPRRRAGGWFSGLAIGLAAGALAAAALIFALIPPPAAAVLTAEIAAPDRSLVIDARLDGGEIALARLSGAAPPGRVLELWLVDESSAPVSLGVLPAEAEARLALPEALDASLAEGLVLAISEEPPGGSPTGRRTGALLATGAITKAVPKE